MEEILDFSSLDSTRSRKKRRFMRIVVPIACVSFLMAALLGIVFFNYSSNRKDALALSDDLLRSMDSQIATEVRAFLSPAAEMVSILDSTLRQPGPITDKQAVSEPLAMQMLGTIAQLAIFSLGDPDGNYLMLKKTADQSILTKLIQRDGVNVQVTWIRRDPFGREIGREHSKTDTYDPRVRPWYTGAVKSDGVFWTDVYVFFTDRKPGITASRAIRNKAGDLLGVVGLDIELTSLSRFLGSLEIGRSGKAMIVDDTGRLVAYPDMARMLTQKGETLITKQLNEMDDPVLERAHNRFLIEREGRRELMVQGKKYINTASSLISATGKHWSVLIVVPAEDFVGFVSHNYQQALIMSIAVLIMAALMAGLLIWQGLRADKNASLLLSRRQAMERQSKAFSDMAAKPAIFDPADGQALKELVQLTADAVDVRRVSVWQWTEAHRQLICCDCYDRESGGHTSAIVLLAEELPQLFTAIADTGLLAIEDSANDPRTAELQRAYLHPLGCNSLLSTTIADQQRCHGVLWLEQEGTVRQWEPETISFAEAVAGLLALRFSANQGQPVCAPVWADNVEYGLSETDPAATREVQNHVANGYKIRPLKNVSPDMRKATLLELRGRRFRKQMDSHGETADIGADIFESVTVLVLQFTDPLTLAHRLDGEDSLTTIEQLIQQMEKRATEAGIAYMKFMSDQLVCATVFREQEGSDHARALAAFALEIQKICNAMLKSSGRAVDFRIGMDTGAVIGSTVGREHQSYNLWGDAVRTAGAMAESGATGEIHVSESTYRLLEHRFIFKVRGRYYLPGVGELATYILTGQL